MAPQKTFVQSTANGRADSAESFSSAQSKHSDLSKSISSSYQRLNSAAPAEKPLYSPVMSLAAALPPVSTLTSGKQSRAQGWLAQRIEGIRKRLGQTSNVAAPSNQAPLIGIIDTGFSPDQHGHSVLKRIQGAATQSQILLADTVGKGQWADSLTQFVNAAKASGQPRAIANLSFDLTQKNPDGSVTTRYELTASERSALDYARQNNVLVVASAGNEGSALSALGQASGQSDNLIVVGAAEGNRRADYSSFGRGLDFLVSMDERAGGTSLAAAETTGVIATLWAANPHLTPRQVVQTLEATAQDLKTPGWDMKTGLGVLNPEAASLAAKTLPNQTLLAGLGFLKTSDSLGSDGEVWSGMGGAIATERPNLNPRQADARSRSARRILRKAHSKVKATRSRRSRFRPTNARQADAQSKSARRILRKVHSKVRSARSVPSAAYTRNEHQAHRRLAKHTSQSRRRKLLTYKPGTAMQSGSNVRRWQQNMKKLGYKIKVDGIYGPESKKAARQFQQKNKLATDGIVGSKTRAATARAIKTKAHRRRVTQASVRISPRAADGRSPSAQKILKAARLKTYQHRARNEHQFHKKEVLQGQIKQTKRKTSKPSKGSLWNRMSDTVSSKVDTVRDTARRASRGTQEWASRNSENISNVGHTVLDGAGFIPVVGAAADGLNGVWYAAEGDWKNAAFSFGAAVPVVGDAAAAAKGATRLASASNAVRKATNVAGNLDSGISSIRAAREGDWRNAALAAGSTVAGGLTAKNRRGIAHAVSNATAPRTYITYTLKDKNGVVRYVGRASGKKGTEDVLRKRASKHHILRDHPDLTPHLAAVQASRKANRGAEDVLYSRHQQYVTPGQSLRSRTGKRLAGGANREGQQLLNQANPVSNKPSSARRRGRKLIQAYKEDLMIPPAKSER